MLVVQIVIIVSIVKVLFREPLNIVSKSLEIRLDGFSLRLHAIYSVHRSSRHFSQLFDFLRHALHLKLGCKTR